MVLKVEVRGGQILVCACRFGFSAKAGSQQHSLPAAPGVPPSNGARASSRQPGLPRPPLLMQANPQIQLSQSQNTFSQLSQNDEQYQMMIVKSQDENRPAEEVNADATSSGERCWMHACCQFDVDYAKLVIMTFSVLRSSVCYI